jgi:DNA polymerase-3 subunit alpha
MAKRAAPTALLVNVDAARLPASIIEEMKQLLMNFPGTSEVVLNVQTSGGARRLRFGDDFKVAPTSALRAELNHVLGEALLPAAAPGA